MSEFADPTEFVEKDLTPRDQSVRFRTDWPAQSWSHEIAGGENVMVLIFIANQSVTKEDAKQCALWIRRQRPELEQAGVTLVGKLPEAHEFPDGKDVHLVVKFELKDVMPTEVTGAL